VCPQRGASAMPYVPRALRFQNAAGGSDERRGNEYRGPAAKFWGCGAIIGTLWSHWLSTMREEIRPRPDDKVYPVAKLATIVASLATEGVPASDALRQVGVPESALSKSETRVSLNQILQACRNAARLTRDRHFAYHTGRKFRVSSFGMYGFAILSATDFREAIRFAVGYDQLATPLVHISFNEEYGRAVWAAAPLADPRVDATLFKFLVELEFGIVVSLHRDVMGPSFLPREIHVTFAPPQNARTYQDVWGCPVRFGQRDNRLVFDAAELNGTPQLGNELTHQELVKLCKELLEAMSLHVGMSGRVRSILLASLMRPTRLETVARHLNMTTRTLRRKLREENTSFRELIDELRMHLAIKYLRDTVLTVKEIAHCLGFSDAANFRQAFRRWTQSAPLDFRKGLKPKAHPGRTGLARMVD